MTYYQILLNDLFSAKIRRRGLAYKNEGRVRNLKIEADKISAEVKGSESYDVEIEFDEFEDIHLSCSCPYFETSNCKHLAAVFYELNDNGYFNGENFYYPEEINPGWPRAAPVPFLNRVPSIDDRVI